MNKDVENVNSVEEETVAADEQTVAVEKQTAINETETAVDNSNSGFKESYYSSTKYPDRIRKWTSEYNSSCKAKIASHKNKFAKFFSAIGYYFLMFFVNLGIYLSIVVYDFVNSIRLSPMKGAFLLLCFPAVFIGFLLNIQIDANYSANASSQLSPIELFAIIMLSVILIASGLTLNKNKSLKDCIICTILVVMLLLISIIYVQFLFTNCTSIDKVMTACILIIMSNIAAVIGVVLAYIFRDRNYKKEKM